MKLKQVIEKIPETVGWIYWIIVKDGRRGVFVHFNSWEDNEKKYMVVNFPDDDRKLNSHNETIFPNQIVAIETRRY